MSTKILLSDFLYQLGICKDLHGIIIAFMGVKEDRIQRKKDRFIKRKKKFKRRYDKLKKDLPRYTRNITKYIFDQFACQQKTYVGNGNAAHFLYNDKIYMLRDFMKIEINSVFKIDKVYILCFNAYFFDNHTPICDVLVLNKNQEKDFILYKKKKRLLEFAYEYINLMHK